MRRLVIPGLLLAVTSLAAPLARADCALGNDYFVQPAGNSVLVCMRYPQAGTLLRQDTATGDVVALPATCLNSSGFADAGPFASAFGFDGGLEDVGCCAACCFEDSCVPAGSYRYGLSSPIDCPNGCGGEAPYWIPTTVTAGSAACDGGATPYGAGAPWPSNGEQANKCSGCSCSSTTSSVLGCDAVLFVVALALLRRRRR